jgi:uncharacterized protein YukE
MSDLKVDTQVLHDAGNALRAVATDFDTADATVESYGPAMGHHRVEHELSGFAGDWKVRRGEMVESVKSLAEAAEKAGQTYEQIESEFVQALTGES